MRAWVIRKKADVKDALRLESDYPRPTAKPGRVLVKVHAVALNPVNWKMIETWPVNLLQKVPGVPESDVAGTVVDGDLDGTGLQIGDSVFGLVPAEYTGKTGQGCLAEYVTVAKELLIKKPDNLSFQQAATLPLATFTALNSLVATGGLKHGANQRVLINGGSGGVGVYAVQIARAYGAHVVTTCSSASRDLVQSLGADEILDYKERPLVEQLKEKYSSDPFDIIFDTATGDAELYHQSPHYLKKKGIFVDVVGPQHHLIGHGYLGLVRALGDVLNRTVRPTLLGGTPRKYKFVLMKPTRSELQEMADLAREGKLNPVVDKVFQFEDALEAYARQKSGRSKGKVVVSLE
ncbi:NAD(P)-binding protein [Rhodotorula sp. JG-1b]|nr:NAD(P)-binding protein [Rhodotorula sp. JG-1b]